MEIFQKVAADWACCILFTSEYEPEYAKEKHRWKNEISLDTG